MQPNVPKEIWSGSQAKGSTVPGSNCPRTALPEAWLPEQISCGQFWWHWTSLMYLLEFGQFRGQFDFRYEVYIQSTCRAREGETCVWWIFYLLSLTPVITTASKEENAKYIAEERCSSQKAQLKYVSRDQRISACLQHKVRLRTSHDDDDDVEGGGGGG